MATPKLAFDKPFQLPVNAGELAPDPGEPGVIIWSTTQKRPLYWDGKKWRAMRAKARRSLWGVRASWDGAANERYQTSASGGDSGTGSGGFGYVALFRPSERYFGRLGGKGLGSPSNGYALSIEGNPRRACWSVRGTSASYTVQGPRFAQLDTGMVHCLIGYNAGSTLYIYLDSTLFTASNGIVGFTASTEPQVFINYPLDTGKFGGCTDFLAELTFRGAPTVADFQAFLDAVADLGDLPWTMPGATVTRRYSVRDSINEMASASGDAGPSYIFDSISGELEQSMRSVQGGTYISDPALIEIEDADTSVYGVGGFSLGAGLIEEGTSGDPEGWADGNYIILYGRIDMTMTAGSVLAEKRTADGTAGWTLSWTSSNAVTLALGASSLTVSNQYAIGNLGGPVVIIFTHSGAGNAVQAYSNGDRAVGTGSLALSLNDVTSKLSIGRKVNGTTPANYMALGIAYGSAAGGMTQTEARDISARILATQRMHVLSRGAAVCYDFGAVFTARGYKNTQMPERLYDRNEANALLVKSDRIKIDPATGALTAFTATCHIKSPTLFSNVLSTTMHNGVLFRPNFADASFPASTLICFYQSGTTYYATITLEESAGQRGVKVTFGNGTAFVSSSLHPLTHGQLYWVSFSYDNTAKTLRIFINGVLVQTVTGGPTVSSPTCYLRVGLDHAGLRPLEERAQVYGFAAGPYSLTDANVATAASQILAAQRVVKVSPMMFVYHYDFLSDVSDCQGTPLFVKERYQYVGPASTKDKTLDMKGLYLVAPGLARKRMAFSRRPITLGFTSLSTANYYYGQSVGTGVGAFDSVIGGWYGVLLRVDTMALTSATRTVLGAWLTSNVNGSWALRTSATHTMFSSVMGTYSGESYGLQSYAVGHLIPILFIWQADLGRGRLSIARRFGTSTVSRPQSTAQSNGYFQIGSDQSGGIGAEGISIFGFVWGIGQPNEQEVLAWVEEVKYRDRVVEIPGRTLHLYDFHQDIVEAGGTAPAYLKDRWGQGSYAAALARAGSPTVTSFNVRRYVSEDYFF